MAVEQLITQHIDTWTSALRTRSTAGRGTSGKIELYGIKKLRELILELAVRGKLVPQDPNDEPASELLKHIAAEKAELVKQGKIKKQKPLPEISEDEKPFELPVGWEWVTLSQLGSFSGGKTPSKMRSDYWGGNIPWVTPKDMKTHLIVTSEDSVTDLAIADGLAKIYPDSLLFVARSGILRRIFPVAITAIECTVNQDLKVLTPFINGISRYILLMMNGFEKYILKNLTKVGTTVESLLFDEFSSHHFMIPPLEEQQRVITKVDELMSLCDQLEQQSLTSLDAHYQLVETLLATLTASQNAEELAENWARISQYFDTLFTTEASIDALKQTILQLAVMGKLVPQDPNDEPASELLNRIEQEKAQLVKEGKIKKQKPLPPISDDEKPFELPEGWEWCPLRALFAYITDGDHQAPPKASEGTPFLVIGNLNKGDVSFLETKFVPNDYYENLDWSKKPTTSDMLYTVTGSYGIPIIVKDDTRFCVQRHVAILKSCKNTPIVYLKNVFLTRYAFDFATKIATGIAQKTVPLTGLREMYIPLPPANEIVQIIEKIEIFDMMFLSLKSRLQSAQQTQLHLADALTDAALN
ncbi:restriction endonuclease subunit S [Serratia proteamaculans]|uniref:restriction endonuclease subunit S n=1 Tax=Serratia proteamaculans TaxID=28151 RepID=UPI0021771202|nr:restriction endonuclease subunit S [Serratia proteamaculans]CAI0701643.1 EcoKI restriction-modification system protein HsdS [Serratia proteamaculans]CAI2036104.1 EcoKI restriction-modification system protein HsdS [Serratia proteamaculans]